MAKKSSSAWFPIAHEFGAAVVVGCIDEDKLQAQAFTRERKLAIAQRSFKLLTEKYGLGSETSFSIRWFFRARRAMKIILAARSKRWKASADQAGAAGRANNTGHFQCFFRAAGGSARGGQLGVPLLLHEGGTGPRDREYEKLERFASILRTNANSRKTSCFRIRRRMFRPMFQMRFCCGTFRRIGASRPKSNARP